MPFDEYLGHMLAAGATIDAPGFGDLTHRTVESLGLGVPLIRPRLRTLTFEPLEAGVHYLDCGRRGELLPDCLEQLDEPWRREALVAAGLDWFERNCTPAGMRALLGRVLATAAGRGAAVLPPPWFDM
jgi:hypothetical protein